MNPNPPHHHDEDDAAFLAALQRSPLRSPPSAWRSEILTAAPRVPAPASVRWHRSPFWRSMAALWTVLLLMALDTWRLSPPRSAVSTGNTPVPSPLQSSELQSLLVSLNSLPPAPLPN